MARIKQTARKSTGEKAPRKSRAGSLSRNQPPRPEHNYLEEARQLAGWRQRATEVDPSNISMNPDECLFDIWVDALGSTKVVLLFCKPDICVHHSGRIYRLKQQDFDGVVRLAHAALDECALIGNLSNASAFTCQPHTILRVIKGTSTSASGYKHTEFTEAKFTSFSPYMLETHAPQVTGTESVDEGSSPELHALTAILSLAYVGPKEDFSPEVQSGPISQIRRVFENDVFALLKERLGEDMTQEVVSASISSESDQF